MSDRVVELRPKGDPDVVRHLENALEEARQGRLIAVAIAAVRPGNIINTRYTAQGQAAQLLGAVTHMQLQISKDID